MKQEEHYYCFTYEGGETTDFKSKRLRLSDGDGVYVGKTLPIEKIEKQFDCSINNPRLFLIQHHFTYNKKIIDKIRKYKYLNEPEVKLLCVIGEGFAIHFYGRTGTVFIDDVTKKEQALHILKDIVE